MRRQSRRAPPRLSKNSARWPAGESSGSERREVAATLAANTPFRSAPAGSFLQPLAEHASQHGQQRWTAHARRRPPAATSASSCPVQPGCEACGALVAQLLRLAAQQQLSGPGAVAGEQGGEQQVWVGPRRASTPRGWHVQRCRMTGSRPASAAEACLARHELGGTAGAVGLAARSGRHAC